ncbi:WBC30 protein, partial [Malurus elegans]|nr:WBC30 protein [Malurus elegans]
QAPSGPCEPGYFCTGGAKNALQQEVMEGHYSSAGAFKAEPCPPGSFQPSDCRECPEGMFCSEPGLAVPQDCPRGRFCPAGSSLPLPCPVVRITHWLVFPAGIFRFPSPRQGHPAVFSVQGMFMDMERAGSCKPCPAGMFCSRAGLSEPEGQCQPGHYCSQGSSTSSPGLRRRCPPGFYCPQKTGSSFYPCPPGTYNPSYGLSRAERCQQCPAG